MESIVLILWIFVVPLHAYVLQPSALAVAVEDPGSEGTSWYEGRMESVGEPLPPAGVQDSHGEAKERGLRAEAGEVEMEERYAADGGNRADEGEGRSLGEDHREGKMHRTLDEEKEVLQTVRNVEEEGEFREGEEEGAHRNDAKKEKEEGDDSEEGERHGEETGKDKMEDEIDDAVNRNLREYRFEDVTEQIEVISSPSIVMDIPHLTLNLGLSGATDMPHLSPNPSLSVPTDIPYLSPNPSLSVTTDISHLSPNPDISIETDISHLSPNLGLSIATDIPYFSSNPGISVETDIPNLSPNPGLSITTNISHFSPNPSPSLDVDQNSSVLHPEFDHLQTPPPTVDNTVTSTVSQVPVTAGNGAEATIPPGKPNSKLVQFRNLTQPHLREEEGLVPKAIEVKLDSFRDLANTNSGTQEQNRAEKERSKFNQPMPKAKKKKTHPAKKTDTTRRKQQKKAKAEEKSKSLKKDKSKQNKNKKKQKENKKVEKETPHFPYYKDGYCPSDCACYGRVVQCSDKGLDKIPYGIPYNARYMLLMNNQISGIHLDLLREYNSLEFLVVSNNLLTDGGIEGAFEGMRQLKRLYLDRNQLDSIPTELPLTLEELRLDGNNVSVMSEVAWAHCPSLQILSLNNNTLGTESVPEGVFTPLTSLRTLSLMHNLLTAVPVHLPTNIKELYLRGNHIDRVPSDAFTEGSDLLVLDLSANRLTNKGLSKDSLQPLVHLENLSLEGNLLRNVPQHLPASLRTLNLEGNGITSVSKATFLGLPHLEHLGLSNNQISRVAPGAFWGLPALHQLELGYNVLRQVPRRLPPTLHSVSLIHNKINSIPRDSFCTKGKDSPLSNLLRVNLEHNLIKLADLDTQAFNCLRGYQVIHFY